MKYVVYLDESRINNSRYSSISAVSLPANEWNFIVGKITEIQNIYSVTDLKWEKVRTRNYRSAANAAIELAIEIFIPRGLRIDSICWDNQDSRHAIPGRDDIKNFERMFFHLLCSLMSKREDESVWGVYPDQLSGIDWETAQKCINAAGRKISLQNNLPFVGTSLSRKFQIKRFSEADSKDKPIIQLADLFAGMSSFSVLNFQKYSFWVQENHPTGDLFALPCQRSYSNSEKEKFAVMDRFVELCTENKMGVSFNSSRGFKTHDPSKPINFWRYVPQGKYDRAPTKNELTEQ